MGWQDVGNYKCVAENELGTAEKTVKIDVAGLFFYFDLMQSFLQVHFHFNLYASLRLKIPF
jgi:hypothetical protein